MYRLIVALPLLVGAMTPTIAAFAAPRLDIQSTCRAAAPLDLEKLGKRKAYEKCIRDQLSARKELDVVMKKASAADRRACMQEAGSLFPSYIELLVCLELSQPINATVPSGGSPQ